MKFNELQNVKVQIADGIAWVSLNRPDKRNAMSPDLHFEMVDVLKELAEDSAVRVLVLTGEGDSWCAARTSSCSSVISTTSHVSAIWLAWPTTNGAGRCCRAFRNRPLPW